MKKIYIAAQVALTLGLFSCQKDFLELPLSNTTTVDSVFGTSTKALAAIAEAYQNNLSQGLPYQGHWNSMLMANLSSEMNYGFDWTMSRDLILNGYAPTRVGADMDGYDHNFVTIRQAHAVRENISRVKDMSDNDKAVVVGEMKALVAYRYVQMLILYGGVPIVTKTFSAADDLAVKRSSVSDVLNYITTLCDEAYTAVPSQWNDQNSGRMTKAAVLAIKAKALLYAARPLFNSSTPYLDFGANNNLISLGNYDVKRWEDAAKVADQVIAEAPNGGYQVIDTNNPLDDYGTATSKPGNKEVLLAFKANNSWQMNMFYNPHNWIWQAYGNALTTNQLEHYYKANGENQSWPNTTTTRPFSEYLTKMNEMEDRFKASFQAWQMDAWNNPGDSYWNNENVWQWEMKSVARPTKFYYKAGTRGWFEFPIFRLASAYLSAAEAYNESGETQKALDRLNVVRNRAGLPNVTETNKEALRAIIQREWAVEFFNENYRYHDVRHWKLSNIADGILGGPIRTFTYNGNVGARVNGNVDYTDLVLYQAFWAPKQFLNPFPQSEVNKGIITQNPGY